MGYVRPACRLIIAVSLLACLPQLAVAGPGRIHTYPMLEFGAGYMNHYDLKPTANVQPPPAQSGRVEGGFWLSPRLMGYAYYLKNYLPNDGHGMGVGFKYTFIELGRMQGALPSSRIITTINADFSYYAPPDRSVNDRYASSGIGPRFGGSFYFRMGKSVFVDVSGYLFHYGGMMGMGSVGLGYQFY